MDAENASVSSLNNRPVYERLHNKIHYQVFIRHKYLSLLSSLVLYIAIILIWGEKLKVSANYLAIIPALVASLSFGVYGGLIGGSLALPMNLLLFHIIGHPEFSPESKIIAEISGIIVGAAFGFLSSYFSQLNREIHNRMEIAKNLRQEIKEKEIIFQEMHHRVKNNLNIIKSLVSLQTARSNNETFIQQSKDLENRIYSIAFVHDQLYLQGRTDKMEAASYLSLLAKSILKGFSGKKTEYIEELPEEPVNLNSKDIVSLSLIVNEAITNSLKYAVPLTDNPIIRLSITCGSNTFKIEIQDNGPGFDSASDNENGLGLKLIKTLSRQIKGELVLKTDNGTTLELTVPYSM